MFRRWKWDAQQTLVMCSLIFSQLAKITPKFLANVVGVMLTHRFYDWDRVITFQNMGN